MCKIIPTNAFVPSYPLCEICCMREDRGTCVEQAEKLAPQCSRVVYNGKRPTSSTRSPSSSEIFTPAHEENVRFIYEAWQCVERDLRNQLSGVDRGLVEEYVEKQPSNNLKSFKPVDLNDLKRRSTQDPKNNRLILPLANFGLNFPSLPLPIDDLKGQFGNCIDPNVVDNRTCWGTEFQRMGDIREKSWRRLVKEDIRDGGKIVSSDLSTLNFRKREEKKEEMADRHSGILESREVTSGSESAYVRLIALQSATEFGGSAQVDAIIHSKLLSSLISCSAVIVTLLLPNTDIGRRLSDGPQEASIGMGIDP
ncbi:unnamed protein product, partial [Ranitomeya imitator]